jgi:hypothetical protein
MIQTIEEPKRDSTSFNNIVKTIFAVANSSAKKAQSLIREYLISFMRNVASVSNLKATLLKYLTTVISENHEQHFKKALKIYEHMGFSLEDRRASL